MSFHFIQFGLMLGCVLITLCVGYLMWSLRTKKTARIVRYVNGRIRLGVG